MHCIFRPSSHSRRLSSPDVVQWDILDHQVESQVAERQSCQGCTILERFASSKKKMLSAQPHALTSSDYPVIQWIYHDLSIKAAHAWKGSTNISKLNLILSMTCFQSVPHKFMVACTRMILGKQIRFDPCWGTFRTEWRRQHKWLTRPQTDSVKAKQHFDFVNDLIWELTFFTGFGTLAVHI